MGLYVIQFDDLDIKVGITKNFEKRLSAHKSENLKLAKRGIKNHYHSENNSISENSLISFCQSRCSEQYGCEYFSGISFDTVVDFLKNDTDDECSGRELFGIKIRRHLELEMYCATDLLKVGNKLRISDSLALKDLSQYFDTATTNDFINALKWEYLISNDEIKFVTKGKGGSTWIHPMVFIDFAMWLHPKLKVSVINWVKKDLSIQSLGDSDSYKTMCSKLNSKYGDELDVVFYVKLANHIANHCGITRRDKERWQSATVHQLKMRDDMQKLITIYCDVVDDISDCINKAIRKVVEKQDVHQKQLVES